MKPVKTRRKQRSVPSKIRTFPPKAPSGEQMLPDVAAAECTEMQEESDDMKRALHVACFNGQMATVRFLVESRPWQVNVRDSQGCQPLHTALLSRASPNTQTCLRYLLEHRADVNGTTDLKQTPLHLAASEGLLECVEILVKAGADVLAKDSMGLTPLDLARLWCHRKVVRYLKTCLWHANKNRELEERRLALSLYRDLMNTAKQNNPKKQALLGENMAERARRKGLAPLKDFSPRVQVSKYHNQCLLPDQTSSRSKQTKNHHPEVPLKDRSTTTRRPAASSCSPWTIFTGRQPENPFTEPDLRNSITLWKDSSNQKLQCITKWDGAPHPTPSLPLDVVERVLFPRAFPSRIATPHHFEPLSIDGVQHRRCPQGRSTSPWTELAMHLPEVLEPGHY